jgi:hypothetical protein
MEILGFSISLKVNRWREFAAFLLEEEEEVDGHGQGFVFEFLCVCV